MSKNIAITGPNGFIAKSLIKRLAKNNDCNIIGVLRENSTLDKEIKDYIHKEVYYQKEEMSFSESLSNVDVLYHLGAYFTNSNEITEIDKLVEDNILFTTALYSSIPKESRVITTTTFSAYDDDFNYKPENIYSLTKYKAFKLAKWANLKSYIFVNLGDTYGFNDKRTKIHNLLFQGKVTELLSDEFQIMNLTNVKDVAEMLVKIQEDKYGNEIDYFYPENNLTLKELVDYLDLKNIKFGNKNKSYPKTRKVYNELKPHYKTNSILKELKGLLED